MMLAQPLYDGEGSALRSSVRTRASTSAEPLAGTPRRAIAPGGARQPSRRKVTLSTNASSAAGGFLATFAVALHAAPSPRHLPGQKRNAETLCRVRGVVRQGVLCAERGCLQANLPLNSPHAAPDRRTAARAPPEGRAGGQRSQWPRVVRDTVEALLARRDMGGNSYGLVWFRVRRRRDD